MPELFAKRHNVIRPHRHDGPAVFVNQALAFVIKLAAFVGIEFSTRLVAGRRVLADFTNDGVRAVDRVEVRHPDLKRDGTHWLVAVVALEPRPKVTYAVPLYREAIERAVQRALAIRSVA